MATKKEAMEAQQAKSNNIENEINELKKKLATHNKETNDARKRINGVEAKLLDKKLERHGILKVAKIDLCKLPMLVGTMEDITDEDSQISLTQPQTTPATTSSSEVTIPNTESLNSVSTLDQTIMFQKEARIKIDYKKLDTDYLNVKKNCQ
jgi:chromosome segregation ATPase